MTTEREIVTGLADALRQENWDVEAETSGIPERRYDVVATAPSGRHLVIEVKTGEGSIHFAALAQLDRYAQELGRLRDQDVFGVLVTSQHVSPTLAEVAARVGVGVVELAAEDEGKVAAFERALDRLRELSASE